MDFGTGLVDLLGAGIAGGASLIGGAMNQSSVQAINQQALQQAQYVSTGQNLPQYYSNLATAARGIGLSPLALLGSSAPSVTANLQAGAPGAGVADAGQNISRALGAFSTAQTKANALDLQAKALDLQSKREDVIAKQFANTSRALAVASPGTPPPHPPTGAQDDPLPMFSWYRDPETGDIVKGLSHQFAGTQFGPSAYYTAMRAMPGLVGAWLNQANDWAHGNALEMRGDIWRNLNNPPPMLDPYSNYGGG